MQMSGRMKLRHHHSKGDSKPCPKRLYSKNEEVIKGQPKELVVRGSVEETPQRAAGGRSEKLTQAARYERNEQRQVTAAATTTATYHHFWDVSTQDAQAGGSLRLPSLSGYRRRESSGRGSLRCTWLARIRPRRGYYRDSSGAVRSLLSTISELNKKSAYAVHDRGLV